MTLIAIAGLCSIPKKVKSSIVLSGDIKQLDAVTKSTFAMDLKFNTSFMEHLLRKQVYKRNPQTDRFNQNVMTQLVKNYRSHQTILHIPNQLFYEGKLQPKAPEDITNWFVGFGANSLLPSPDFPVVFHTVKGKCEKTAGQYTSSFNLVEVNMVFNYIQVVLRTEYCTQQVKETDVGVVTPYSLQAKKIQALCGSLSGITIGPAEVLQGKEKQVIIVSTVSVNANALTDFVLNYRRMNVMLTRPHSLLIIVGDHSTMENDSNWKKLIDFCKTNNSLINGATPFTNRSE